MSFLWRQTAKQNEAWFNKGQTRKKKKKKNLKIDFPLTSFSLKNARALSKGEQLGLAQFAAVELGQKAPPKPRLSKSEVAVEQPEPPLSEAAGSGGAEEETGTVVIEAKKPPVNAASAALAAALTGSPAFRKKSATSVENE